MSWWRPFLRDIPRIVAIILICHALVYLSVPYSELVHEPAFASWGLFTGGAFFAAALSHIIRRILFHDVDLQLVAREAKLAPTGAGLVFLGVCLVLAAFITMFGAMLRV